MFWAQIDSEKYEFLKAMGCESTLLLKDSGFSVLRQTFPPQAALSVLRSVPSGHAVRGVNPGRPRPFSLSAHSTVRGRGWEGRTAAPHNKRP
ncbi:hypothetical protein SRHO_G00301230 [Serrasalmus rhombeus]